jgi:hypothetical protein
MSSAAGTIIISTAAALTIESAAATRVRYSINDPRYADGGPELAKLSKAFTEVKERPRSHAGSFINLANPHGIGANVCEHHKQTFVFWHREFILRFENALRSVPGCEDVSEAN